jgi:hypothetical protein
VADPDKRKLLDWQDKFDAAVLETDPKKVSQQVNAAEAAIFFRLQAMSASPDEQEERDAIDHAVRMLRVIKREMMRHPGWISGTAR